MATWNVEKQAPSSTVQKLNERAFIKMTISDAEVGQSSYQPTKDAANSAAKTDATSNASDAADEILGYGAATIISKMWTGYLAYTGGTNKDSDGEYPGVVGNVFYTQTSDKSVGTAYTTSDPHSTTLNGVTYWHGDAECSWSAKIGCRRRTYVQCYNFGIKPSIVKKAQFNISLSYSVNLYVAISSSATFPTDYTSLTYQTFTGAEGNNTITLNSTMISALQAMSTSKTSFYLILGYASSAYQSQTKCTVSNVSLSVNYSYTACTAPTSVKLSSSIVIPDDTPTISWSGATAGVNNPITGYIIQYTKTSASGATETGTLTKIDSTSTSGSSTGLTAGERGSSYKVQVQTIGTESGYNSDFSTASATFKVNQLPTISVSGLTEKVPSYGGTISAVLSGSDVDNQTLTFYVDVNGAGKKKITGTSWTSDNPITTETTIDFYAYDGLEYSAAASKTISVNPEPTYKEGVALSVSGKAYESELLVQKEEEEEKDIIKYCPVITYSVKTTNSKTGEEELIETSEAKYRDFRIVYNDDANVPLPEIDDECNVYDIITKTTYTSYSNWTIPARLGVGNGYQYRIETRYYDGIEWSDWLRSTTYRVAPWPKIVGIYNGFNGKTVTDTTATDFYKNFSILFTKDTAFFGANKSTTTGFSVSMTQGSGYLSSQGEAPTGSAENCINAIYESSLPADYGQKIYFQAQLNWLNNSATTVLATTKEGNPLCLRRCVNLMNGNISGLPEPPDTFKPYSKSTMTCAVPFIGGEGFDSGNQELNLGTSPLSASVEFNNNSYALSLKQYNITSDTSINTEWNTNLLTEVLSNKIYNEANFTATYTTLFGEVFSDSKTLVIDYKEPINFKSASLKILTGIDNANETYTDITNYHCNTVNSYSLYEGEKIQFSLVLTGKNIQNARLSLYGRTDDESEYRLITNLSEIYIGDQTNEFIAMPIYVLPEQNADVKYYFRIRAEGEDTGLKNDFDFEPFYLRRFTKGEIREINGNYYEGGSFSITPNILEWGISKNESGTFDGIETETTISLQYYDKANGKYSNLSSHSHTLGEELKIPIEFKEEFPSGLTNITARLQIKIDLSYPEIETDVRPINWLLYNENNEVIKNQITKLTSSYDFLIYNIVPTVRYGCNRVGLNIFNFSTEETNLLEIAKYDERNTVAALGDAAEIYLDNFVISGGKWD